MGKTILLVDVDSKIPNLALMKLSTYYKSLGYEVKLHKIGFSYYPKKRIVKTIDATPYDKVFISIIFKINKPYIKIINCKDVTYGGVGYSLTNKLHKDIERLQCDYTLYPENKCSYGFITRGCIRNCYFCVVPKKEGMIHKVNCIDNIIKHKKVIFFDNNILAFNEHNKILKKLVKLKVKCSFNQGLDIRLINNTNAKLLSKLNYEGEYFFAFDNINDLKLIEKKLRIVKQFITKDWKIKMFLYCNPNMNIQTNILFRVNWCKENKVLPYLMRDITCWDNINKNFYIDLAAWCNQPAMFKKITFQQFLLKRTNNINRQKKSMKIYTG